MSRLPFWVIVWLPMYCCAQSSGIPNLTGHWVMNASKSDFGNGVAWRFSVADIAHDEPNLSVTRTVESTMDHKMANPPPSTIRLKIDGQSSIQQLAINSVGFGNKVKEKIIEMPYSARWIGTILEVTSNSGKSMYGVSRLKLQPGGLQMVETMETLYKGKALNTTKIFYERDHTPAEKERIATENRRIEEESERRIVESRRSWAASFTRDLLRLLEAAKEGPPFASIKSDFDLNGIGNRSWKTSLALSEGKCRLERRGSERGKELWTYHCQFAPLFNESPARFYSSLVELAKTATGWQVDPLPETTMPAVMLRRDASGPAIVVERSKDIVVSVWPPSNEVAAVGQPTQASGIGAEIDRVLRNGSYQELPAGEARSRRQGSGTSVAEYELANETSFQLRILINGPTDQEASLAPDEKRIWTLSPGAYRLMVTALSGNVLPLFRAESLESGTARAVRIFVQTR